MFLMRDPLNQPPLSPFRRGQKEIRGFLTGRTSYRLKAMGRTKKYDDGDYSIECT